MKPDTDTVVRVALGLAKNLAFWVLLYAFGYLRLDVGWLLLVVVAALVYRMWAAQREAAVADPAKADPAKAARGDLPAWVMHPDQHRAEWCSLIFKQLWPHLDVFLKRILSSVEEDRRLQQRLAGYHIHTLKFPHVSLGVIPPKVAGIKVHHSIEQKDEIIVDLSVQYHGDLSIGMEVTLSGMASCLPATHASISNMTFVGDLRLHLRPLLTEVPFFGGVTVSFLRPPEFDFDLGGMANALDLPGLAMLLRHVIQDQLEQTIVMPNSVSVSLVALDDDSGRGRMADRHSPVAIPEGVLSVHLVEAKGLVNKDLGILGQGKSDPYAKVQISTDGVTHTFRTAVVPDELHPVWKLLIDVPVDDPNSIEDLLVDIWDEDPGQKDDFLGKCCVSAQVVRTAMTSGQTQDVWKRLEDVRQGSFHAEVSWAVLKLSKPETSDGYHGGVLVVHVDSCANLLGGRQELRQPNPVARVEVCGVAQSTAPVVGSADPVFARRMMFMVRDPAADALRLTVVDDRTGQEMGTLRYTIADLLDRPGMSMCKKSLALTVKGNFRGEKVASAVVSLAFRYIHRPMTSSFGVHKSLQDLQKIMMGTMIKPKGPSSADVAPDQAPRLSFSNGAVPHPANGHLTNGGEASVSVPRENGLDVMTPPAIPPRRPDLTDLSGPAPGPEPARSSPFPRVSTAPGSLRERPASPLALQPLLLQRISSPKSTRTDREPKVKLTCKYNPRNMTLSVVVHRARNLQETQHTTLPCPYVKIYAVEPTAPGANRRINNSKKKTKSQKNSVNPVFEETLEYFVHPDDLRFRRLEVIMCSSQGVLGRNVDLGRCLVTLRNLVSASKTSPQVTTHTEWYTLGPASTDAHHQTVTACDTHTSSTLPRSSSTASGWRSSILKRKRPKRKSDSLPSVYVAD